MEVDRRAGLTVSIPVLFLDTVMPRLKDTELRLLLSVLRQTAVAGQEREAAWLTHSELRRRTGRAGEAVSAAIASLSASRLLEVRGESGQVLAGAKERQSARSRCFYRLGASLTGGELLQVSKWNAGKPKTIVSNKRDIYSLRLSKTMTAEQSARIAEEKRRIRERLQTIQSPRYGVTNLNLSNKD